MKESVHIIAVGAFGRSVSNYLHLFYDNVLETIITSPGHVRYESWPRVYIRVVASWRPIDKLCSLICQVSGENNTPFLPLILDFNVIRLGPVIIPHTASCWNCWLGRSLQHEAFPFARLALNDLYEKDCNAGPQGFLEAHALLAAARVAQTIEDVMMSRCSPGFLWQMDLLTRAVTTSTLIGVHDCPQCGLGRAASSRTFNDMRSRLSYLWNSIDTDKL